MSAIPAAVVASIFLSLSSAMMSGSSLNCIVHKAMHGETIDTIRKSCVELSRRPAGGPFRAQAERNDSYAKYVQHG